MGKITSFSKDSMKMLRPELQAVLDMIKDEYGINLEIGTISFTPTRFTCRLTGTTEGKEEGVKDDFAFYAPMFGLEEDDRGKSFGFNCKMYKIIEIKPSSKKYPIICQREDGKRFKFSSQMVRTGLGK